MATAARASRNSGYTSSLSAFDSRSMIGSVILLMMTTGV